MTTITEADVEEADPRLADAALGVEHGPDIAPKYLSRLACPAVIV